MNGPFFIISHYVSTKVLRLFLFLYPQNVSSISKVFDNVNNALKLSQSFFYGRANASKFFVHLISVSRLMFLFTFQKILLNRLLGESDTKEKSQCFPIDVNSVTFSIDSLHAKEKSCNCSVNIKSIKTFHYLSTSRESNSVKRDQEDYKKKIFECEFHLGFVFHILHANFYKMHYF